MTDFEKYLPSAEEFEKYADALGWLRSIGTTLGCEGDERAILETAQAIMFERHSHSLALERARLEAKIEGLMEFRVEVGNETGIDEALAVWLDEYRKQISALEGEEK